MATPDLPFEALARDVRLLHAPRFIDRIPTPDPLFFYREFVAKNRPCIITDATAHWPALSRWTNEYLREKLADATVTIDITPDGFGDVVRGEYFVTPVEEDMKFSRFLDLLSARDEVKGVHYCQHQNNSFREQFSALQDDIEVEGPSFAKVAFGAAPDAVNFWMGDERAVSSMHHDPYDNIYCVIAGEKHFTLLPPTDLYWLGRQWFNKAHYKRSADGTGFDIVPEPDAPKVPWFPADIEAADAKAADGRLPAHFRPDKLRPLRIVLKKGESLYLPSLWYHRVAQKPDADGRVIAVNFWYDMPFGPNYTYFRFYENVMRMQRPGVEPPPEEAEDDDDDLLLEEDRQHDTDEALPQLEDVLKGLFTVMSEKELEHKFGKQ